MKKKLKFTATIMVALLTISIGIDVYAKVIEGYNQVTAIGGENDTNTINEKDGVKVSKTIAETELENYFDITLKVNTNKKIEEILRDQDLAIVIVMDVSNTMIQYNVDGTENNYGKLKDDGTHYPDYVAGKKNDKTRYASAIKAGENFINEFAKYSSNVDSDTKRKLGYVAFNSDATKVFELTDCKDTTQATNLINNMKTKTEEIVETNLYSSSRKRFTNIEAGLKMARNMLKDITADNKYVIFLSDGLPTTYIQTKYTGYDTYNTGSASGEGIFYNDIRKKPCTYGASYSNEGAIRARKMAVSMENDYNITIYTVGTGIDKQKTVPKYLEEENAANKSYSVIDTKKVTNFEVGNTIADFKKWLKNSIGTGEYYDATDKDSLEKAYTEIFKKIKDSIEISSQASWVAEDPMGVDGNISNIEFLGLYDDLNDKNSLHDSLDSNLEHQSDTASYTNNKITWDLKNSECQTITENGEEQYIYEIKYRIRLQNELDTFDIEKIYETNGKTTLTYVIRKDGILSENKYIDFPIPSIVGYLGNLTFTKKSSYDNSNLSGAQFKLVHDENCKCHQEKKYANIADVYATSNEQGTITFTNIPSGHIYKLIEITAPVDYILSNTVYNITVSYGETTGVPLTNIITNDIKKTNLEIKKIVEGNNQNSGTFKFDLELWFKNNKLTGNYNYKINNDEIKVINIGTDIIELNNNDTMIIYDLPVGTTYKITETTFEGYEVQYELNSNNRQNGNIVICNNENSCRLEEGSVNKVKFINIGGYLLPATGSSGMLILLIIGSLLLIGPIIYIGYINLKHLKKVS